MTPRLMILALLLVAGCEPTSYWDGIPAPQKVETVEQVDEITLSLTDDLAGIDDAALRQAVRPDGASISLDLLVPAGTGRAALAALRRSVTALGIPADRVRQAESPALAPGSAVVRIHRVRVKVPACAPVPSASMGDTTPLSDRPYRLGCATAANFALMLADPRDLSATPGAVPVDGEAVVRSIDKWRSGANAKSSGSATAGGSGTGSGSGATPSTPSVLQGQ